MVPHSTTINRPKDMIAKIIFMSTKYGYDQFYIVLYEIWTKSPEQNHFPDTLPLLPIRTSGGHKTIKTKALFKIA